MDWKLQTEGKRKELSVELTIKTIKYIENWKSRISLKYFGVPDPAMGVPGPT